MWLPMTMGSGFHNFVKSVKVKVWSVIRVDIENGKWDTFQTVKCSVKLSKQIKVCICSKAVHTGRAVGHVTSFYLPSWIYSEFQRRTTPVTNTTDACMAHMQWQAQTRSRQSDADPKTPDLFWIPAKCVQQTASFKGDWWCIALLAASTPKELPCSNWRGLMLKE